ncbi:MAG: hypothetical protein QM676_14800 [Novosphingobium sp.]
MLLAIGASLLLAQATITPPSFPEIHSVSEIKPGNPSAGDADQKIPAHTSIELSIEQDVGSKLSKSGQTFPIRLAKPIVIDGKEMVAVGAGGQGEVVHAKKGGGSGAPGELILAARYLEVGNRRLPLRSLRLSGIGKDNIAAVDGLAVASAASPVPVALIGFMITGGEKTVAKGSLATAKTAAEFSLDGASAAETLPNPAPSPDQTGGKVE